MNNEIKEKWVKALRSGQYEQGQHYLKSGDKFCCLGVLCDLAAKEGICEQVMDRFDDHDTLLPLSVQKWAGLAANPHMGGRYLSGMNDSGTPFKYIALVIEEEG